jgi:hypothetical protein
VKLLNPALLLVLLLTLPLSAAGSALWSLEDATLRTMRREFLDHILFWNTRDLERKLAEFQAYYNEAHTHESLNGLTPLTFVGKHSVPTADLNHVRWVSYCRDLVQLPAAA